MKQVVNPSDDAVAEGYEKALQHKNKLLEYDRTRHVNHVAWKSTVLEIYCCKFEDYLAFDIAVLTVT